MSLKRCEVEDVQRRMMKFYYDLSPEQRKSDAISGEPTGMCDVGKSLFDGFCEDPFKNPQFVHHFGVEPEFGGCTTCRDAFLKYLFSITN
jgi:hypothetical protein